MIRYLKISLIVSFCILIASAFWGTSTQAQDTPSEKVFKNIQALKGFPASQMTVLMEHFNKSLGVECTYCHVENALEKGDKPAHKKTVEEIKMTREIASRFKTSLDCMSCHQGKTSPPVSAMASLLSKGTVAAATSGKSGGDSGKSSTGTSTTGTGTTAKNTTTKQPDTKQPDSKSSGQSQAEPPVDVAFAASFGRVPFPHGKHMEAVSDCNTCHHTGEMNKCSTCHQKTPSAITKIRAQDAAHSKTSQRSCAGCHLAQKVGPTTCAACHKR